MKSLDSVAYKQVRAGGFGSTELTIVQKRKRIAKAFIVLIIMIVVHQVLVELGWAA